MCRAASDTVPIVLADDLQIEQQRRQKRPISAEVTAWSVRRSPSPVAGSSEAGGIDSIVGLRSVC